MNESEAKTSTICIEIGGTKTLFSVGKNISEISNPENIFIIPTTSPVETFSKGIQWILRKLNSKNTTIPSIGIASFGPLCLAKHGRTYGYISNTPKLLWKDFNVVGFIVSAFPNATIGFDTDVNGAALGESRFGAGNDCNNILYITIGTGIGAGVVINGAPLHGLLHPEAGHMRLPRVIGDDFPGSCPFHGDCWEGLCSGPAILKRTGRPAQELVQGSEAWNLMIQYDAWAIGNLICTLSPERVIIGGGVSKGGASGHEAFFDDLRKGVLQSLNGYIQHPSLTEEGIRSYIVPPQLGDNSGICGAFALAQAALKEAQEPSSDQEGRQLSGRSPLMGERESDGGAERSEGPN